jgi:nitrous oxidase accessory protein
MPPEPTELEQCLRCSVERVHVVGLLDEPLLRGDAVKVWESDDAIMRDSVVEDSRDIVVWYSRRALLDGNFVTRSRYGAHFMYAHDATVRRMRVVDNVVGIFVMYSSRVSAEDSILAGAGGPAGMGIGFKDSDDVTLTGNWLVGNTLGTYLDSTPRSPGAHVHFERNVLALNDVGIRFHGTERGVSFFDNDLHENAKLAEVEGGGDALGVEFRGNYFSSYEGYDLDRNGMGDVSFEEKLLATALFESHPSLKFLDGSLAMRLIEAASRAVPVLAARTLLRDPLPRMRPERLGSL